MGLVKAAKASPHAKFYNLSTGYDHFGDIICKTPSNGENLISLFLIIFLKI